MPKHEASSHIIPLYHHLTCSKTPLRLSCRSAARHLPYHVLKFFQGDASSLGMTTLSHTQTINLFEATAASLQSFNSSLHCDPPQAEKQSHLLPLCAVGFARRRESLSRTCFGRVRLPVRLQGCVLSVITNLFLRKRHCDFVSSVSG